MPYIPQEMRETIDNNISSLVDSIKISPKQNGILNYIISRLTSEYTNIANEPSYDKINNAIGVLECAKLELYRRVASEYENKCIITNGDIYGYQSFPISRRCSCGDQEE